MSNNCEIWPQSYSNVVMARRRASSIPFSDMECPAPSTIPFFSFFLYNGKLNHMIYLALIIHESRMPQMQGVDV